jgi:hypothetical protein
MARQLAQEQNLSVRLASERLKRSEIGEVRKSVRALHASVHRQLEYTRALQRYARVPSSIVASRVVHRLERIAAADRPILIGPWTDDVGVELVYWVPFIRWFAMHFRVPPAQLHVVSRGGAPWYGDIAETYTDILSSYSPSEFQNETSGRREGTFRGFERRVVRSVRRNTGQSHLLLHPGLMYRLFAPFWAHDAPIEHIVRYSVPKRVPPPAAALAGLPQRFVAVRFTFNRSFPMTSANRAWLDTFLASLTQRHHVVWLGPRTEGIVTAEQSEYAPPAGVPVHRIDHLLAPERSIAIQAAVIARADAYIGTYNGMSYLAPFYGVRSVAFYAIRNFFLRHRSVAEYVFDGRDHRSPVVVNIADDTLLRGVLQMAPPAAVSARPVTPRHSPHTFEA